MEGIEIVGVAADHGGFELKEAMKKLITEQGYEIRDFGSTKLDPEDDFPDMVSLLARAVGSGELKKGVAFCGSGVGASVVANKVPGVFACLINETYSAHQGVEHDSMNLLCLGGRVVGEALAAEIVKAFLNASYIGSGRFKRRVDKIIAIEQEQLKV